MEKKYKQIPYRDRLTRNNFIATELKPYLGKKILNIGGGGERFLARFINDDVEYIELDIAGQADIIANLEEDLPLNFKNDFFDTIICTDVLEHLDNLHDVFAELVRLSSEHIIISLPNPLSESSLYFRDKDLHKENISEQRKVYGNHLRYYGLPFEKPFDRHKWFFSFTEAVEFIEYQSEKYSLEICELFSVGDFPATWKKKLQQFFIRKILSPRAVKNFFAQAMWSVFKKKK